MTRSSHDLAALLTLAETPDRRGEFIHRLESCGFPAECRISRTRRGHVPPRRRDLILALAELDANQLSNACRENLIRELVDLYRHDDDTGVHSATAYALWRFGRDIEMRRMRDLLANERRCGNYWFVNSEGHTMVVLSQYNADSDARATSLTEGDGRASHRGRPFAMASELVTVERFLRFRKNQIYSCEVSPEPDCPINGISWYEAAAYCNWLSEREGLPPEQWCYTPNDHGEYSDGLRVPAAQWRRKGYRLPLTHEWEFACRAGPPKDGRLGEFEAVLPDYACYSANSGNRASSVGVFRPNNLGLFDLRGNMWEFCQSVLRGDDQLDFDNEPDAAVEDRDSVLSRGGAFNSRSCDLRDAAQLHCSPRTATYYCGFRVVRPL